MRAFHSKLKNRLCPASRLVDLQAGEALPNIETLDIAAPCLNEDLGSTGHMLQSANRKSAAVFRSACRPVALLFALQKWPSA